MSTCVKSPALLKGTQHMAGVQLPWCVSWGLSGAKPAWLSGGTPPTKAPVDGEGKSAKVWGCEEEGVTGP